MAERSSKSQQPSTVQRKAEARREEKLELIRQQVEEGSLVIRQMTDAERSRYPVKPAKRSRRRS